MKDYFTYNKKKRVFTYSGDLNIIVEKARLRLKKLEEDFVFETQLYEIFKKRYDNIKNNILKHKEFIACAERELKKQQDKK